MHIVGGASQAGMKVWEQQFDHVTCKNTPQLVAGLEKVKVIDRGFFELFPVLLYLASIVGTDTLSWVKLLYYIHHHHRGGVGFMV
jgi:hypothetical protein